MDNMFFYYGKLINYQSNKDKNKNKNKNKKSKIENILNDHFKKINSVKIIQKYYRNWVIKNNSN